MKVTLITVTYNSDPFLTDCIQSVIRQNYSNIEYIVIDGGSTDGTLGIIKQHANYIDKWISEKDDGIYDAINKGLKMATGDIIGVLHSDDMLASRDVISTIVQEFQNEKVDSVYGDLIYVDKDEPGRMVRYWKGCSYKRSNIQFGWMPAHPTFYIKKEIIDKLGGYEKNYSTAADYELIVRYLYRHRISCHYVSKLMVKMRTGGASNVSLFGRLRANRGDYKAMLQNKIPFPVLASVLKPLRKIPQYYINYLPQPMTEEQPAFTFAKA